jgi:outer membrane protein insertion porin family
MCQKMKQRHITQIFAALMACALSGCDREKASGSFHGRSISKIEFRYQGARTVEEQRLRSFVISKPGDLFTPDAIDSDVKSLYESGLVDDVRFLAEPDGAAVRLIAEVTTRRPFGPPFCIGNTAFSDRRLADATGLSKERPITVESLKVARNSLKDYYVDHGYPEAEVECRAFNGGDPSPDDFVFVVVEGEQ